MANPKAKRPENIDGNFFVDSSCINCGTCYWVAGATFRREGEQSAVYSAPTTSAEVEAAYRALYSCPTHSIGVHAREPVAQEVLNDFPVLIRDNVYHTGFHAESSFGATSYFIRQERGNILIDSPRFVKKLAHRFKDMGGIALQLLTHRDDIADTDKYWEMFQSKRMIHVDDITPATAHYEGFFEGEQEIALDDNMVVIPVPGHTKGSCCFLYKNKFLFTGDHLAFSHSLGHLYAFKGACWHSFEIQIKSLAKLLDYRFEYVLPGHGAPFCGSPAQVKHSLEKCLAWAREN